MPTTTCEPLEVELGSPFLDFRGWLPPGWGQGIRHGQKRRNKVFVAPAGHGSLIAASKQSMASRPALCERVPPKEVILQTHLEPLDQHGKLLGLGNECFERWPKWLPQDTKRC